MSIVRSSALATLFAVVGCGAPPVTQEPGDAADTAPDTASAPPIAYIYREALMGRSLTEPLLLDLRTEQAWFIHANAVPYLDRIQLICPDGATRDGVSWLFEVQQRVEVNIEHGFLVTGSIPPEAPPNSVCAPDCQMCPDGALICTNDCPEENDGPQLLGEEQERKPSGNGTPDSTPPPDGPGGAPGEPSGGGEDPCGTDEGGDPGTGSTSGATGGGTSGETNPGSSEGGSGSSSSSSSGGGWE